ncbi:MAG TPA: alkaline phosphatase [Bryobacteraceae bacterium]|nr:alkaline phosphatase [Bryobacteraceae bacterium]
MTTHIEGFWLRTALCALSICGSAAAQAQTPSVRLLLPERTRLLQGQLVDVFVEVRNAATVTGLKVMAGSMDITSKFSEPVKSELDCDTSSDWVIKAPLQSFETPGAMKLEVTVSAAGTAVTDSRMIQIQAFDAIRPRNIVLFIGDAMGTAYRDAARLVYRSVVDANGKNSFREGFFDNLLEMDKMPVSGMSMTYGSDSIVPDSANTGTAWATGNKSFLNAVNMFADGTDCRWRFNGQQNAANLQYILDNPRVENLWQYLKRRFGYRAGIVSTAAVTDATPAVQGAYVGFRQARLEIARQYRENPMLGGRPAFDVVLGGGADPFTAAGRPDKRDLISELRSLGYQYVTTAAELRNARVGAPLLGLFKGSASPAPGSNGITTAGDVNMDVAYDKLGLQRPASEPNASLGSFTDQPMLELMTQKAIDVLSANLFGQPFILMVEAASIDKQSHPNNAAGTIWDTIEMDKAVGVARAWAAKRPVNDTLIVVTADHDQSLHIIGVSNTPDTEYFEKSKSQKVSFTTAAGAQDFTVYGDAYSNVRAGLPFVNASTGASNNGGAAGMPSSFTPVAAPAGDPAAAAYSTYFGFPAYKLDPATGYPVNSGAGLRRLAVGFRTGDHTGSSVPLTAQGPGAYMFTGYMDQSDIFFKLAAAVSTDTTEGDKFVDTVLSGPANPKTFGK